MTVAIVAVGVTAAAGIAGGAIAASGAKSAAKTQAKAARDASQIELDIYNQNRDDQEIYRAIGGNAFQRLSDLSAAPLAYGEYTATPTFDPATTPYAPTPAYTGPTEGELRADPGYRFRVAEGQKALERSASAKGLLLSGGQLKDLTRFGQDVGAQEYAAAYGRGYARNADIYGRNLTTNDLNYGRGYQQNADVYGRNLSQYQTNYNRLLSLRGNQFRELATLSGAGQGATNTLSSIGATVGGQLAENAIGAGNAIAAGKVGAANAYGNIGASLAGAANSYANYNALSSIGRTRAPQTDPIFD